LTLDIHERISGRGSSGYDSIMRVEPIAGRIFDQLWEFLETA
jgi:hypothetical protein